MQRGLSAIAKLLVIVCSSCVLTPCYYLVFENDDDDDKRYFVNINATGKEHGAVNQKSASEAQHHLNYRLVSLYNIM